MRDQRPFHPRSSLARLPERDFEFVLERWGGDETDPQRGRRPSGLPAVNAAQSIHACKPGAGPPDRRPADSVIATPTAQERIKNPSLAVGQSDDARKWSWSRITGRNPQFNVGLRRIVRRTNDCSAPESDCDFQEEIQEVLLGLHRHERFAGAAHIATVAELIVKSALAGPKAAAELQSGLSRCQSRFGPAPTPCCGKSRSGTGIPPSVPGFLKNTRARCPCHTPAVRRTAHGHFLIALPSGPRDNSSAMRNMAIEIMMTRKGRFSSQWRSSRSPRWRGAEIFGLAHLPRRRRASGIGVCFSHRRCERKSPSRNISMPIPSAS